MQRRGFLKSLGTGLGVAAIAATLPLEFILPPSVPMFGEYADYCNFSEMALSAAIDEDVRKVAEELGRLAAEDLQKRCYWAWGETA